ncbi:RHS repeat domain-containing protein [Flavitalea flava]
MEVKTSRDSIVWERDAAYSYYKHGPLARMVLGQLQPQGLDYSYTLQGWLKGVNIGNLLGGNGDNTGASCTANTALDDATVSSRPVLNAPVQYTARGTISFIDEFTSKDNDDFETQLNNSLAVCSPAGGTAGTGHPGGAEGYPVGRDAYSFSLHYYPGDYKPIGSIDPVTGILEALPGQAAPLFNGNIAAMAVNIPKLGDPQVYNKVYNYHYDQLNRLSQMDAFNGLNTSNTTFTPIQLDDYKEKVSYDPSGNIMTYLRRGTTDGGKQRGMDSLSYDYYPTTNQLKHIGDNAAYSGNYTEDIDNQTDAANYTYDAIGNLKTDIASSITGTGVEWTVYGKIAAITKAGSTMTYTYDASGNRITKTVGNVTTVYVRDAQGNVMSVYQKTGSNPLQQQETHLYGSSRLGILNALTVAPVSVSMGPDYANSMLSTFTRGEKNYELSNHLGNVLAAISDKKIAVSSGGSSSLIDHYEADVTSAQDYYPFGMQMPGRTYSSGPYRYGFNGKENDNEVKGVGNQIDYGMRVYDPRIGKFLSVDPLTGKFPELTPYQYASNTPIQAIDLDGLEQWELSSEAARLKRDATNIKPALGRIREDDILMKDVYGQGIIGPRSVVEKIVGRTWEEHFVQVGDNVKSGLGGSIGYLAAGEKGAQVGAAADNILFSFAGIPDQNTFLSKPGEAPKEVNPAYTESSINSKSNGGTVSSRKSAQLAINRKSGAASEDLVRSRLQSQLGENESILSKPRIYIGDGSSGKFATPDFAIYNTQTGLITRIVDAKDGGSPLSKAQLQLNEYGGVFRGSSRATDAAPQSVKPNMIEVERTEVNQQ